MKTILKLFIKGYKKLISPILGNHCRFTPTCSEYAIGAIDRFGAIRGSLLAIWRILRCNPFGKGGYDPVPERFTFKRQKDANSENLNADESATELVEAEAPAHLV